MLVQLTKSLNNNSFVTNDKGEIEGLYYWDGYQYIKYNLEPGTSRITSIEDNYESSILESAGVQMYGKHVGLRFADFGMVYEKRQRKLSFTKIELSTTKFFIKSLGRISFTFLAS